MNQLTDRIFNTKVENFEELCFEIFRLQYLNNNVYQKYCNILGLVDPLKINSLQAIPFIPVELFKNNEIKSFNTPAQKIFYSSATKGIGKSAHYVFDLAIYERSFIRAFERQFGDIKGNCFLGLLPSYLEREGSSLVYMVKHLMELSGHPLNGFFLYEHETLHERILHLEKKGIPYFLFGVSFALLDYVAKYSGQLKYAKIIETGGMKGRKKEMTRQEMIQQLKVGFETQNLYSEYGMTELMSQAYAGIDGRFSTPPWMKIQVVDPNDPYSLLPENRSGLIRIIDLANLYSCSFLQTSDLGKKFSDNTFEVSGRLDNSDLRGCSLMLT